MNYTIIGDNVNLASRLEGANKIYGTKIIISEDTYRRVADSFLCCPLDIIAVKGKRQGTKIYQLLSSLEISIPPNVKLFCKYFESGFNFYLHKDWDAAIKIFGLLEEYFPEKKLLKLYQDRCLHFQSNPDSLPAEWDGTTTLESK